jgi:iron(III) transport system ATP-binding protein
MSGVALRAAGVEVAFGDAAILRGVDLEIDAGEIHVLLGDSGSGKTTLLRAIAGFEPIAGGSLELFGERVADERRSRPPERRQVGVVFQDYALFPHLDVAGNVGFGMRERAPERIAALLEAVGLAGYGDRAAAALSGGEQQRVALARALAQSPRLILFDEPFSNLTRELRERLRRQTAALVRERRLTALFVTHDRLEAFALADRLSVIEAGRILETGDPRRLYGCPRTAAVARALGACNLLEGERLGDRFRCALGEVPVRTGSAGELLMVRPEAIALSQARERGAGALEGTVTGLAYRGARDEIELAVGGATVLASAPAGELALEERVAVALRGAPFALVTR